MPFDAPGAAIPAGYCGGWERNPDQFIPYHDHVAPDVVQYRRRFGSAVAAVIRLDGASWTMASDAQRTGSWHVHYGLLQLLADRHTEITEHLCVNVEPACPSMGGGGTPYAREFWRDYRAAHLSRVRTVEWYLTIAVYPGVTERDPSGWLKAVRRGTEAEPVVPYRALRLLESKVQAAMAALRWHGPRRLGVREGPGGVLFSEIGAALVYARTLRREAVPLAQPAGSLGPALYTDRVRHGPLGFMIDRHGGTTHASYGRMVLLQSYPNRVRHGMMDALLAPRAGTPLEAARFVVTNQARPLERAAARDALQTVQDRLLASGGRAEAAIEDVRAALSELTSGRGVRTRHAWSLAVHADSVPDLDEAASDLFTVLKGAGAHPVSAGMASEAAYWGQWPGNRGLSSRPARIPMDAMACLSPLDGFPTPDEGPPRWGAFLAWFLTPGGTLHRHDLHSEQNGNALFIAPVRSGKTLLAGALMTQWSFLARPGDLCVVLDKDRSNALAIRANGGSYTAARRGEDSGFAPLLRLADTPGDRALAADLVRGMILAEDPTPILPVEDEQIAEGVAMALSVPAHLRSIGAVHAYLPPGHASERLRAWCRGHRLGWALDGARDDVDLSRLYAGVDLTELLDESAVLPLVSLYLTHLVRARMDGVRRILFVCEEARFLLNKPSLARHIEDFVYTGGKHNLVVWLVTQQPEHILDHPSGGALLGQFRTRFLFKNDYAQEAAYRGGVMPNGRTTDGMHCTEAEFEEVSGGLAAGPRGFVLQRPGRSEKLRFDISAIPHHIPVLSSFPQNVALWDALCVEAGTDDPATILPLFRERLGSCR